MQELTGIELPFLINLTICLSEVYLSKLFNVLLVITSSLCKVDLFYIRVDSIILNKLRYYGIYKYNTSDQFSASLVEPLGNNTQPCLASTLTERRLAVLSTLKLVEQNL